MKPFTAIKTSVLELKIENDKGIKMAIDWTNIPTHAKRLQRTIRRLEKNLKKTNDHDLIIRYSAVIGVLTDKIVSLAKLHLGIDEVLKKHGHIHN